jgi:hypothetical protein
MFDETNVLFEDLITAGLAEDYVLKPVFQSGYNNNVNNISGLGISYLFLISDFNEL